MKYCIKRTLEQPKFLVDDCLRDIPTLAYWKTCVPCSSIETPRLDESGFWTCVMCNQGENMPGKFNYAAGEYCEDGACTSCNECSVFEPTPQWSTFSHMNSDKKVKMWEKEYEDALRDWVSVGDKFVFDFIPKNNLACIALQRRKLNNASSSIKVKVEGTDYFRDKSTRTAWMGQLFGKNQVTGDFAIHYNNLVNNTKTCTYKHCKDYCQNYQYSQGCGQNAEEADMWVRKERSEKGLKTYETKKLHDLENEIEGWGLMHHGKCESCTLCMDGQYNDKCNKRGEDGVKPSGKCKNCLQTCGGTDEFLWHPTRVLRACNPLDRQLKGKSEANYECKRCPTWIRKDGQMSAVIGCGNKKTFDYHTGSLDTKALSLAGYKSTYLKWTSYENDEINTLFKPFWALKPYCPAGYFFDQTVNLCDFTREDGFELHSDTVMEFGWRDVYKVACCKLCNDCDKAEFRQDSKWLACDGASMEDTQGGRCVSNCQTNYYIKNLTAAELAEGGQALPKGNCCDCS